MDEIITQYNYLVELALYLRANWSSSWGDIYSALSDQYEFPLDTAKNIRKRFEDYNVQFVSINDDKYPERLKENINKPPFVIAYKGDINLLNSNCVLGYHCVNTNWYFIDRYTIVCRLTEYETIKNIFINCRFIVVVEDLDTLCHLLPKENTVLISSVHRADTEMLVPQLANYFVFGNTPTSSALANKYFNRLMEDKKYVMAIPGVFDSWGNNKIKQGAHLIDRAEDVRYSMPFEYFPF